MPWPRRKVRWEDVCHGWNGPAKWDFDGVMLTKTQKDFVDLISDKEGQFFMNPTEAYRLLRPKHKNHGKGGWAMMNNPEVKRAIKDRLTDPEIDNLLEVGVRRRLEDPESPYWQPTADYIAKIRGDFAPDRQLVANVSVEDRRQKLEAIAKIIDGEEVPETVSLETVKLENRLEETDEN